MITHTPNTAGKKTHTHNRNDPKTNNKRKKIYQIDKTNVLFERYVCLLMLLPARKPTNQPTNQSTNQPTNGTEKTDNSKSQKKKFYEQVHYIFYILEKKK